MTTPAKETNEITSTSYLLSVVIPTRNEHASAPLLISQLAQALPELSYEVVLVDDSDDDTPELAQRLAAECGLNLRVIHREGQARRGGLSTAVIQGVRAAQGEYVCIMDADLQHPIDLIVPLLSRARDAGADIVIASRYLAGGSDAGLSSPMRKRISWASRWLVKILFFDRLGQVSDPLSGFFVARHTLVNETRLRPIGFKILLDILIRSDWTRVEDLPLLFAPRAAGVSKATLSQGRDFLAHTARLFLHHRLDWLLRHFRRPR